MSCRSLGAPESYPAVARRRYPQQVTGRLVPAVPGTVRSASRDGAAGAGGARDSPLCLPLRRYLQQVTGRLVLAVPGTSDRNCSLRYVPESKLMDI
eukprot:1037123-Prorocentrum_minimum.AAC.1